MHDWTTLPSTDVVNSTILALQKNNISAQLVTSKTEVLDQVYNIIPQGSEVFNATSVTLSQLGLQDIFEKDGRYISIRQKLNSLNREHDHTQMQQLGAAPDWIVGSVHAVTQDGAVFIASATGSQLPAYAAGASHVLWLVGTQKIVSDTNAALLRLQQHCLPLESERARQAYGVDGSSISKLLIVNHELNPDRIKLIFIPENLGY